MSKVVYEIHLILSDVVYNSNKTWVGLLYDNEDCETRWGRVGDKLQSKLFPGAGRTFLDRKEREKLNKGYQHLKTVKSSHTIKNENLESIAMKQIDTDSQSETKSLIKYLVKINAHNILSSTIMTYDESSGVFSTPLGVVTAGAIDEARALLTSMSDFVARKQLSSNKYIELLNSYLRLIPQKVGRKLDPKTLYPDLDAIRKQNDILDSLEASLKIIKSNKVKGENTEEPKLFEAKLSLISDPKIISYIKAKYQDTRKAMHAASKLSVDKVYSISIVSMSENFEKFGRKIGNVMELWHGTKASNLLSILKSGFVIPPANSAHCTGRMFGNGVYFSDQSSKSLNYSYGYWGGVKDSGCFMLLNDVAMGHYFVPDGNGYKFPVKGFDSTFAKGGRSGVLNNEMIVYSINQINPKYLVKFS